jgi:CRP-like cAMP-binding protein
MSHVYFPTSGMCSVVAVTDDGKVVETATVGNEGMIGIPVLLGLDFSPSTAISQVSGTGLRMPAPSLLRALGAGGSLDRLLRRLIAFSLRYAYQTVVCNAQHSVEERMCRWLLMTQDRVGKEEFVLTQEFLAEMLAVRRQTVTVFAGTLQTAGFITYRRGVMRVISREGLEAASCECYQITKSFYDGIMK